MSPEHQPAKRLTLRSLAYLLKGGREKWIGRRVNDEVEMFEEGMKDVGTVQLGKQRLY